MMGAFDRRMLRSEIGNSIISAQKSAASVGAPMEEVLVEIIDALLSLAAYVSRHNAGISCLDFMLACEQAAREQWGKDAGNAPKQSYAEGFAAARQQAIDLAEAYAAGCDRGGPMSSIAEDAWGAVAAREIAKKLATLGHDEA